MDTYDATDMLLSALRDVTIGNKADAISSLELALDDGYFSADDADTVRFIIAQLQ